MTVPRYRNFSDCGSEESGVFVALFGQTYRSGTGCSRPAALTFDKFSKVCKKGTECSRTVRTLELDLSLDFRPPNSTSYQLPRKRFVLFVCLFVLLWKPYRPRPHYRESK